MHGPLNVKLHNIFTKIRKKYYLFLLFFFVLAFRTVFEDAVPLTVFMKCRSRITDIIVVLFGGSD